jgi:hypothetical protein
LIELEIQYASSDTYDLSPKQPGNEWLVVVVANYIIAADFTANRPTQRQLRP